MALIPDPLPTHPNPNDRDLIIDWARNLLAAKDFVIMDTETTGFGPTDEIIQIGIIDANGTDLVDSLVKPEKARKMPTKAQEIHGISMKMLKNAPTFFELFPSILEAIAQRWIICYNDAFDMRLLEQTASKYDFSTRGFTADFRSKCALAAYSQFIGAQGKYANEYAWQRLPRLAEKSHNAVEDCHLTLDLMQEIAMTPKQIERLTLVETIEQENVIVEGSFTTIGGSR